MNETIYYDNKTVRNFAVATIIWGLVGMLVGLLIAVQLFWPFMNLELPQTTFGRMRPLHTNAVIFAFVGNGIFMGVYYSLQRLLKARMWSDFLSKLHFWGWQFIIVLAAVTIPFGLSQGKEYAELEWWIDILVALIWVVFGINMFGTILTRREKHIYVAIWFYIATFCTVAVLHIVNSISLPISFFKSYSVYAGVQDALVQWWYGHNAVAFFLTTPYLGLMYYFLPKAANRPVYSYRLSIVHFWSLIFLYIWAGPHHLLYTALPDWAQSLGTVFSVMLIAPSWGGMVNGLLTLRGAWDKVRESVVLKFLVVAVTAYGMATFEGPMLSLKNVNAIAHYTDWIVAHVHVGALGWNGFLTFGILYWLFPILFRTELYSNRWAGIHFWVGTLGIVFYALPMYVAGFTQSLMWKEFDADGYLVYKNFLDTLTRLMPLYQMRALGGLLYLSGAILMAVNLYKTAKQGSLLAEEEALVPSAVHVASGGGTFHRMLETKPLLMLLLATIVILIGGIVEMIPTFMVKSNIPTLAGVKPYTPLELHGRDIYVREGCYTCHSQMIRPFRSETERYGDYSRPGEFVFDHPFQWGSKRTGPDLAREGYDKLKKSNAWHYTHFADPRILSPGSVMPAYTWLLEDELDTTSTGAKIRAMQLLGVPYPEGFDKEANADIERQAKLITDDLAKNNIKALPNSEVIALIAYMQRLGTDMFASENVAQK